RRPAHYRRQPQSPAGAARPAAHDEEEEEGRLLASSPSASSGAPTAPRRRKRPLLASRATPARSASRASPTSPASITSAFLFSSRSAPTRAPFRSRRERASMPQARGRPRSWKPPSSRLRATFESRRGEPLLPP